MEGRMAAREDLARVRRTTEKHAGRVRASLLTRLTALPHLWCVYNFSAAILILVWMRACSSDLAGTTRTHFGWRLLLLSLEKCDRTALGWGCIFLLSLLPHHISIAWLAGRSRLGSSDERWLKAWDALHSTLSAIALLSILAAGLVLRTMAGLPLASSLFILLETARLVTVAARRGAAHSSSFHSYLYFLFAPTLLYKISYPKTKVVRWKEALQAFVELLLCLLFISCLLETFAVGYFSKVGTEGGGIHITQLIHASFECSLAATLCFVYGFYCISHAKQNLFAALMCFADREFYKAWWLQDNHRSLLNDMNLMMHQFFQEYFHPTIQGCVQTERLSSFLVYLLPGVVCQVVFSLAVESFLPVLLVLYIGLGSLGTFIDEVRGNIFVWSTLIIANGLLWMVSSMEYYARANCPKDPHLSPLTNFLLPKVLNCQNQILITK